MYPDNSTDLQSRRDTSTAPLSPVEKAGEFVQRQLTGHKLSGRAMKRRRWFQTLHANRGQRLFDRCLSCTLFIRIEGR